ncbi:MAG: outer membrane lipoprotein LolB [Pseudomonadota bacterium]
MSARLGGQHFQHSAAVLTVQRASAVFRRCRAALRAIPGLRHGAAACAVLCISACSNLATLGPSSPHSLHTPSSSFALEARFSVQYQGKRNSGQLSWQHRGDAEGAAQDRLLITGPLGQGVAEIVSNAQGARLSGAHGEQEYAATATALTDKLLGYPVSLERLADWVQARAIQAGAKQGMKAGDARNQASDRLDAQGRVAQRREGGWFIEYEYEYEYAAAALEGAAQHVLPERVRIKRIDGEGPEIYLRINTWQALDPAQP